MGDLIARGRRWLAIQRAGHVARSVTYSRGESSAACYASIATTRFEQVDSVGRLIHTESRDFIIPVGYLALIVGAGPQTGDRIYEPVGTASYTYEVMAPGTEAVYSLTNDRTAYRIHTKYIGRDPVGTAETPPAVSDDEVAVPGDHGPRGIDDIGGDLGALP